MYNEDITFVVSVVVVEIVVLVVNFVVIVFVVRDDSVAVGVVISVFSVGVVDTYVVDNIPVLNLCPAQGSVSLSEFGNDINT